MNYYRISGLSVASEIELPGLAGAAAGPTDVSIRRAPVPEHLPAAEVSGPTWEMTRKQILLRIPSVVRFLMINGREIVFEPETEAALPDIPIFILGTAFGLLMHQRQRIVLHASAVAVAGKAVLFCGPSGAGKSTMAATLSQRGHALLTDDVCAVTIDRGVPLAHPDGRQLKLWAQAVERLDLAEDRRERVRTRLQKFYVEPRDAATGPLPIGAVYVLREARVPHPPGIEAANVVDAALRLRANAYRPQMVRRLGQQSAYFGAVTAIADAAGVFTLTRKLDFAKLPEVIDMLDAHWIDLRLGKRAA